jgi:DNA-binding NtrC family response regulator
LKILIAEDDPNTSRSYLTLLGQSRHQVVLTENGEDCLIVYNNEFRNVSDTTDIREHVQPFDAVILGHRIPKMKGLEVAKEIISINPHQRIIIASSYHKDIFDEAADNFGLPLEILQKPFLGDELLNMLNDTTLYEKLTKSVIDVEPIKKARLRHEQLKALTDLLDKIDKKRNTG